ncbi:hypothetical protein NIES22_05070 [Calothrix brevissima NIES-22]|nr:hypothetical protein NIES22_05070 [Calothrix brevissima NIES-22]
MSKKERRFKAVSSLDDVEIIIQEPCQVRWADMEGNSDVRKCHYCQLNVYNFLSKSPDEIINLINLHEGKLCAQFFARYDVTMTIESCQEKQKNNGIARGKIQVIKRQ